jgi:hypothetical protein
MIRFVNGTNPIRHDPQALSVPPSPVALTLAEDARAGRLVFYLGAGVSIPSPACGPRGNEVADLLKPIVAELLGVDEDDLSEPDLETLAARVEAVSDSALEQLKVRAADVWGFRDMDPNYAHEAIAVLLREGLVTVVSANWDCGVENGGRVIGTAIEGVSRLVDRLALTATDVPIFKVHGCAKRPTTLVLTRSEVDEPRGWARGEVQGALSGTVVFVGLGTVGAYVEEPVEDLRRVWIDGKTTVRVVDPGGPSDAWQKVLAEQADSVAVRMGADEFLDDVIRAVASAALSRVAEAARSLHAGEQQAWSAATVDGMVALRAALLDCPGDAVMRWWRDGVSSELGGRQFIFDRAGQVAALCVAQLAASDSGQIEAAGKDGNLAVRTAERYFEIACAPNRHRTEVERSARLRVERRRRSGCYSPGLPVAIAIHGANGSFPSP